MTNLNDVTPGLTNSTQILNKAAPQLLNKGGSLLNTFGSSALPNIPSVVNGKGISGMIPTSFGKILPTNVGSLANVDKTIGQLGDKSLSSSDVSSLKRQFNLTGPVGDNVSKFSDLSNPTKIFSSPVAGVSSSPATILNSNLSSFASKTSPTPGIAALPMDLSLPSLLSNGLSGIKSGGCLGCMSGGLSGGLGALGGLGGLSSIAGVSTIPSLPGMPAPLAGPLESVSKFTPPGLSSLPSPPSLSGVPGLPSTGISSSLTSLPGAPSLLRVPSIPGVPSSLATIPGTQNLTNSLSKQLPGSTTNVISTIGASPNKAIPSATSLLPKSVSTLLPKGTSTLTPSVNSLLGSFGNISKPVISTVNTVLPKFTKGIK